MKRIITATAAATLCLAAPAAAATMHRPAAGVPTHAARIAMSANAGTQVAPSTNWAGYTVTGGRGRFSQVYATFHVPGAVCALTDTSQANAAGFWVGLDGVNSATVEQEGITESCDAIGAAHQREFGGGDRGAAIVVRVDAEHDRVAAAQVPVDPFDLVGVDVRGGVLDGRRKVDHDRILRRRSPFVHDRLADLFRELQLRRGEGFG